MAIRTEGEYSYGDEQADIHDELKSYAVNIGYPLDNVGDCACECGGRLFELLVDETQGVGARICAECGSEHVMADGGHYVDDAELVGCRCLCDADRFELSAGVSRYRDEADNPTDDVRWFYIGCRCPACGLLGCYADWKNEFNGYESLMANI